MPFNGAGSYSPPGADFPAVPNTLIESAKFNAIINDISTALSTCITKDGQTTITANIPFNGFRITGLGAAAARTDAVRANQVQDSTLTYLTSVSGADTIVGTSAISPGAYAAGQQFQFIAAGTNTGAVTLNVSGLGAKAVTVNGANPLVAGDIPSGATVTVMYDGTQFQLNGGPTLQKVVQEIPFGGANIINGKIVLSVNAGALTVELKTLAGNDASDTDPIYVKVPQLTSNVFNGTYETRSVTAALSMVVPSGATLAQVGAVPSAVYFGVLDNTGAIELVVSKNYDGHVAVISTTALSTGADGTVFYSTTSRSNVPYAVIERWKSTQATAGTWASTSGERQLYPFPYKKPKTTAILTAGSSTLTFDWDTLYVDVDVQGAGGGGGGSSATGGGQIAIAGPGSAGGRAVKNGINVTTTGPQASLVSGAFGAAGTAGANNGGTGGNSSYNDGTNVLTANGGVGGLGAAVTTIQIPSLGGTATGGDLNIPGQPGTIGNIASTTAVVVNSSGGGHSVFGPGGRSNSGVSITGIAGLGNGSGGGGAANTPSQPAAAGGAGTPGAIVIKEYYQ